MENTEYKYLDLLERPLDPIQKNCCCAKGNSIVAAGAGSGKTQVLATRFAWLVMSKNVPAPEILTLTFTKKAAGEMYQRIYQILNFFAHHEQTPKIEKERALKALEDFSEVHIQTLDSYCSGIVKQVANRYGIRPDFNSGSAQAVEDIKNLALPFVFSNQNNKAIRDFVKPGDYQNFANEILSHTIEQHTSLISPDNFFCNKLEVQKEALCRFWNYLVCGKGSEPIELQDVLEVLKDFADEKGVPYVSNLSSAFSYLGTLMEEADTKDKFFAAFNVIYPKLQALTEEPFHQISPDTNFDAPQIQNDASRIIEIYDTWTVKHNCGTKTQELRPFSQYMAKAFLAPLVSIANFILQFNSTQELFALMDTFLVQVNRAKRISGNLTFADISELALKALQENEDIRIQEQNSFSHIMIDEFQDNNSKNRDLLFLITGDKEKLFFVGDEKQSIYKFRGAEVSVFNQLKNLESISQTEPMTYNYRSTLEMITAFNKMFSGSISVFDNKTEENYEATYQKSAYKYDPAAKKIVDFPKLTRETVPVHLHLLNSNQLTETHLGEKDQLAYFIAKTIHDSLENDSTLHASDFAILDKSRTDRKYLTKWLNYFNINYTQDMNKSLFADGPVNDIYNYLRLCVYPADKNARAAYLASPFCSKDINEVMNNLAGEEEFHLPDQKTILSQSLCKTLEQLWIDHGYYYETILNQNTALYASDFDMLFELARQCDANGKSISWFVDQLSLIKDSESGYSSDDQEIDTSDLVFPLEKDDCVQIMTIHKSKGLQFNKVFLYGCINMTKKSDKGKFFFDEKFGVTFTPSKGNNIFFQLQKALADKKEIAEVRRLIYVGVTRAINTLYIVGAWNQKKSDSDIRLLENMIFAHYPELEESAEDFYESLPYNPESPFDYNGIFPVTKDSAYGSVNYSSRNKIIDLETVNAAYEKEEGLKPKECISIRKTPSSLEPEYVPEKAEDEDSGLKFDESPDVLTTGQFTAADFGTLVHSYLEAYANGISPDDYVPEPKLLKNLTEAQKQSNKNICIKMTKEFIQQDIGKQFQEAKASGRFYKAEWAFRMFYNESLFTGSIDLIFENPDNTYTIVDYKSDNEINCEKYRGQQDCYLHAASKLLGVPEEKITCVLYFLKHKALHKTFE